MSDIFDALPDYVIGFEPWEVKEVITDYVCPICHGQLVSFNIPNDRLIIIVCPEHGNVESIGRVRRESVSREMENSKRNFDVVIDNLPEFWGELKRKPQSAEQNLKELGF